MNSIGWGILVGTITLSMADATAQSVTLDELLDHAAKTNPNFQSIELNPKFAELDYKSAVAEDWYLFGYSQYYRDYRQWNDTNGHWGTSRTEFGVSKLSPATGVRFSTSYQYERRSYRNNTNTDYASSDKSYDSNARISVDVPVWNNAFGYASRRGLEQSEIRFNTSRLHYQEDRDAFFAGIGHQFISLCVVAQRAAATQNAYQRATDLVKHIENRAEMNSRARYAQHAARFEREMSAQNANARTTLESTQVGMSTYYEYPRLRTETPECDLFRQRKTASSDVEIDQLIEATRRMQNFKLDEHALQLAKEVTYDRANPNLELRLNYQISGADNNNSERSLDRDARGYGMTLVFNYPIGNTRAYADIDRIDLSRITFDNNLRDTKLQLQRTLRGLLVAMRAGEQIIATQKQRVENARGAREQDMRALAEGHLEIGLLEDSLRYELDAELALIGSAAAYQNDYLSYQEITNQLSVKPAH
ncbi:MAG: hypothetical protein HY273_11685 [Gammaproteobacteria bacterium]|nr:hypothetical protein [Gammaproteobacteria bacterium]